MKITTEICKQAIVDYLKQNPGIVFREFGGGGINGPSDMDSFEADALVEKNWKRFEKQKGDLGTIVRGFDCQPYDDQLRAYVTERDGTITHVEVVGE
jgi:hypothetical protein